jgi:acylphosphatase
MQTICLHAYITGKVQGVSYRREALEQARHLGLGGWAQNLPDGRVEVMICGERHAVESLCDWLWEGSRAAKVTHVEIEEVVCENIQSFEVR